MEFVFIVCVVHYGCGNAITIMIFMMQNLSPTTLLCGNCVSIHCISMRSLSAYTAQHAKAGSFKV